MKRIIELDGVRAISILMVLAAHLLPIGPGHWGLNSVSAVGGMSLFFCLSGFLIVSFLSRDQRIVPFLIKRVTRIVPAATAATLAVLVVYGWSTEEMFATLLYYRNYVDNLSTPALSPFWSLCVEMHFYFGIAAVVLLMGRKGLYVIPLVALAVLAMRIDAEVFKSIRTHLRVDEILSGGCLALAIPWLMSADRTHLFKKFARYSVLVAGPLWIATCFESLMPLGYIRPYAAALFVGSLIVNPFPIVSRVLSLPIAVFIAKISYSLYIWHMAFRYGWFADGSKIEVYALKRPVTIFLTVIVAWASTETLEKWANQWGRRLIARYFPDEEKIAKPAEPRLKTPGTA